MLIAIAYDTKYMVIDMQDVGRYVYYLGSLQRRLHSKHTELGTWCRPMHCDIHIYIQTKRKAYKKKTTKSPPCIMCIKVVSSHPNAEDSNVLCVHGLQICLCENLLSNHASSFSISYIRESLYVQGNNQIKIDTITKRACEKQVCKKVT